MFCPRVADHERRLGARRRQSAHSLPFRNSIGAYARLCNCACVHSCVYSHPFHFSGPKKNIQRVRSKLTIALRRASMLLMTTRPSCRSGVVLPSLPSWPAVTAMRLAAEVIVWPFAVESETCSKGPHPSGSRLTPEQR